MKSTQLLAWSFEALWRGGWAPLAVFLFHVVAIYGFDAYGRFPRLDIPMHYVGGMAIAWFFHQTSLAASRHGVIGPHHRITHTVLVFALTCSVTVFWEFAEYLTDHFFGTHAQDGLEDTLKDMLLGTCGGLTLIIALALLARRTGASLRRAGLALLGCAFFLANAAPPELADQLRAFVKAVKSGADADDALLKKLQALSKHIPDRQLPAVAEFARQAEGAPAAWGMASLLIDRDRLSLAAGVIVDALVRDPDSREYHLWKWFEDHYGARRGYEVLTQQLAAALADEFAKGPAARRQAIAEAFGKGGAEARLSPEAFRALLKIK